jgi:hypothetical protein
MNGSVWSLVELPTMFDPQPLALEPAGCAVLPIVTADALAPVMSAIPAVAVVRIGISLRRNGFSLDGSLVGLRRVIWPAARENGAASP